MKQTASTRSHSILSRISIVGFAGFVIIGLLFALADIVNYTRLGDRFTPFSVAYPVSSLTWDETQCYAPGPRRFYENTSIPMEVDLFELRNAVSASYPVAHSIIIGSMAKLVGSLETSWVIAHAVFPALIWLLFFFCARMLQLPIASSVVLATATCLVPFGPRNFLLMGQDALIQPLELTRMAQPGLSFALLLLAVMAVARAAASGSIFAAVTAGILVGLNFYTYYFYWIAIGLGLGAWLGTAAILRRWNEVKTLCIVGLTATVTGLPFLVRVAVALQSQAQLNVMERTGAFSRHLVPTDASLAVITTIAVIWFYSRDRMQPLAKALAFTLVGGVLGLNVHLLTGYNAQHGTHFMNRCVQPLLFFLLGLAVLRQLPRIPHWRWLCALATVALVSLGAYRQVHVAHAMTDSHDRTQNTVQLVEILRERIAPGSVVGSSDQQVFLLLPAISTLWTFVPLGYRSMASNEEALRRFLLVRKLEGATISDVHEDFYRTYPLQHDDRSMGYMLFHHLLYGRRLHAKIDQIWPELNLTQDLLDRRLDVLVTIGTPPPLPQSSGWQLVKGDPIERWSVFYLQPVKP